LIFEKRRTLPTFLKHILKTVSATPTSETADVLARLKLCYFRMLYKKGFDVINLLWVKAFIKNYGMPVTFFEEVHF